MSLKSGPESPSSGARPWSLAARLTVWYGASSFALVLAASVILYEGLKSGLEQEDIRLLSDKVLIFIAMLREKPSNMNGVRRVVEFEMTVRQHEKIYSQITDGQGRVLSVTPDMPDLAAAALFSAAVPERPAFAVMKDPLGTPYRICSQSAMTSDGEIRFLQFVHDITDDEHLLASYRDLIMLLLGAALVACTGMGYFVVRNGIRPVEAIANAARRVQLANLQERIDVRGLPAELADLAENFNAMLDRLDGSFDRLSRFSADLAHELRTPVNRLRGEAEVALRRDRSPAEYREALASCLEECIALSQFIERLLFLARAEDPRTHVERRPLSLAREMSTIREFYGPAAEEAGIRLDVEAPVDLDLRADPDLFQRALCNLVSNALAHTPRGGRISMGARMEGDSVRVEVRDTGGGIPAKHMPHVFDRFYRADEARSRGSGGAGLGLAIVKTIAELHGGRVEIASEVGAGTCVDLVLPRDHYGTAIPPSSPRQ